MGLFSFFNKNKRVPVEEKTSGDLPEIPKDIFIEEKTSADTDSLRGNIMDGISQVYSFLQADYESKGYSDSLVNPDDSYKSDNIKLIKFDLQILIEKVGTYYENIISELNFHIDSRRRAGLVDLVKELENRKSLTEDYRQKLNEIKNSLNDENGMCQRIILSYQRGFMRGLSAITQSNVLNKKL